MDEMSEDVAFLTEQYRLLQENRGNVKPKKNVLFDFFICDCSGMNRSKACIDNPCRVQVAMDRDFLPDICPMDGGKTKFVLEGNVWN